MGFSERILSKSNSYVYFKENYESLKSENKKLKKELDNKQKKLQMKTNQFNDINYKYQDLLSRFSKDYIYYDVDSLFSKLYVNPFLKYPFTFQAKGGFAFMEHLTKKLAKTVQLNDKNPLVSIILPVHNYEKYIQKTVNDVINQTYANFELIIVDDGSNDDTLSIINSICDERIKVIVNENEKGLSHCRNIALNQTNGDYIFYLEMHNTWQKKYLESMVGAFLELPESEALYSGYFLLNKSDIVGMIFGVYNKALLLNKNYISLSAFAHKKDVINKVKFDESLNLLEDWYFICCVSKNCKMYSVPILQTCYYYNKTFADHQTGFRNQHYSDAQIKVIHDKIGTDFDDFSKKYSLTKKISIIIPSYEILDDLKQCIETILSFNLDLVDIIVVDNNSNHEVRNYLKKLADLDKIKLIQNDVNYSFTYAIEQGISLSDKDSDILIFNNDAILTKGSLEAMQYYSYNLKDCGIVVPQQFSEGGDKRINICSPFPDSNYEMDVNPSKSHVNIINVPLYHDGEILELTFAPFFCAYVRRDVYNKTLGLDAEIGRHYSSDRIFSGYIRRVLKLKIYHISDAKVYHKLQQSTRKLKENSEEYEDIYVKNKWEKDLAEKLGYENPIWKE